MNGGCPLIKANINANILKEFCWLNEPSRYSFDNGLIIQTDPNTDFWQRTDCGFRNDNGHCLLKEVQGDFSFTAHFEWEPKTLYDQCGVIVRLDEDNWIKASVELENSEISRLGSVVTNLGYSDWATTDIPSSTHSMGYRISLRGQDFLIENSFNGEQWAQMRIGHLHKAFSSINVGVYACSPLVSSFQCKINTIQLGVNEWLLHKA